MTSASWIWSRTFWIAFTGGWRRAQRGRLLVGEGQDHRVEADHPVLLPAQVEVVSLHVLGTLFEGDHGLPRRHLAERVGAFVEPVAAAHDLAIPDRRALRAVHPDVGGELAQKLHQEVDAVDLHGDLAHGLLSWSGGAPHSSTTLRESLTIQAVRTTATIRNAIPRPAEPRSSEPIPKRPRYTTTQPKAQWSSSRMPGPSPAAPGPAPRRQPGPPGLTLAQKRCRCSSGSGGVA